MVGDAAAPVATLVATEAMVAERKGLVVEEGTVQAMTVEAMTVGTTAWLSSFFYKRACNSAKGREQSSNTRDPLQNHVKTSRRFQNSAEAWSSNCYEISAVAGRTFEGSELRRPTNSCKF
jgi:hypothetical protein